VSPQLQARKKGSYDAAAAEEPQAAKETARRKEVSWR